MPSMSSEAAAAPTIKRRKGSKKDKTGCLTCRYRHKKCVENTFPTCGACMRLNLKCIREPPKQLVQPPSGSNLPTVTETSQPEQELSVVPVSAPSLYTVPASPFGLDQRSHEWPERRQIAMRYYISELANHYSVSSRHNSFLSDFLPMAMESTALWDSLLTLASRHLSLSDSSYEITTLEAQAGAIEKLKLAISSPRDDLIWHKTNAATCLIFSTALISTWDCKGWYAHMRGAHHFILTAKSKQPSGAILRGVDAFKTTAEGQWVLRNFAYHDIIGSVTLARKPLMDPEYLEGICDVVDSYTGTGTTLLKHFARIVTLGDDLRQGEVEDLNSFQDSLIELEGELLNWVCPFNDGGELGLLSCSYRDAGLILLYRLMRRKFAYESRHTLEDSTTLGQVDSESLAVEAKIQTQVTQILQTIAAIPVSAAPEAAFLFPLFIAGAEIDDEDSIVAIRTRLWGSKAKRNFQNIPIAMGMLECIWQRRRAGGLESVDWEDILQESGLEIVLT